MDKATYKSVGKSVRKKDSMQLLLGKPVYTEDIVGDALVVKLLRSPHANAIVEAIDTSKAKKVDGVVDVYTWEDVPNNRFSNAGQSYPETSPYDRLIIDRHVRYVGDVVAIVAAETEEAANKALSRIKVTYDVLDAVLDFRTAMDNPVLVHPEDNWHQLLDFGGDNKRNLVSCDAEADIHGDLEAVMDDCDIVLERTYHTKAFNQAMMETFRTYASMDAYGRLHVISSTQIVFHVRRILSHALGIPKGRIRVEKPRIGGGFGAKQTAVCEVYPAFVALKTGRPAMCVFTRKEAQTCGSPRHEMEIKVRMGADNDGRIRALDVETLSNSGAYGEHGWATVGLSGHKSMPLYTGSLEASRFKTAVVYTNMQPSGAYRGFGATQGQFAVETTVNELAEMLGMDPAAIREKNMLRRGMIMTTYHNGRHEPIKSCGLDECLHRCRQMFDWDAKYPVREMGNGKVRAAGMAISMQGSGIAAVDTGSATVRMADDGSFILLIGAADMGTGCDTILAQMVAEHMDCPVDNVSVFGADTDASPYDSGSYASSTTYITGMAVEKACIKLKAELCAIAAKILNCDADELRYEEGCVLRESTNQTVSLSEIAEKSQVNSFMSTEASATHSSPISPPPFMVGMVEIELDKETGVVEVLDYASVIDCGFAINPALARIQAEGGIVQGIGHTLMEDVTRSSKGKIRESNFLSYRLPTRLDTGRINVEFEGSHEPTGPFGAKSIGEIVVNTPAPALAHAIYRVTGVWHRELPILPEHILLAKPEE